MMVRAALMLVALALAGCDGIPRPVKEAVKLQLRDPESARFQDVSRCADTAVYSGKVNAKNAFGGYTGFTLFYAGDGDARLNDGSDDPTFERLANECLSAMRRHNELAMANLAKTDPKAAAELRAELANTASPPAQEGR